MLFLKYAAAALIGYLMGCSNMAFYLAKMKKVDLQAKGSGNLGASNSMIIMGWKAGILVGVHDIAKSAIAVFLVMYIFPGISHIGALAGIASVLGHIFPFWLKFKGGKGFASYFGVTLALDWKLALALAILILVVTIVTDYIVVGTLSTILIVPAWHCFYKQLPLTAAILCIGTVVMLYKHRENLVRICKGTEIGLRRANRGDYREK